MSINVGRGVFRRWKYLGGLRELRSSGEDPSLIGRRLTNPSLVFATPRPRPCSTSHKTKPTLSGVEYGNETETGTLIDHPLLAMSNRLEQDSGSEWSENECKEVPPSEQLSLRVAIVGTPNAGKSTLINQLIQQKVGRPCY